MGKKKAIVTAPRITAKQLTLIGTAGSIGRTARGGFAAAVQLARNVAATVPVAAGVIGVDRAKAIIAHPAMRDVGLAYRYGFVAMYLLDVPAYAKRWHNMDEAAQDQAAAAIYAKAGPDTDKPDRRTAVEHAACRGADSSWSTARRQAGISASKGGGRKPRPAANDAPKAPPVDLVKASPTLKTKEAVNDYFATACAALLATVDKNAKRVAPQVSSALTDLRAAFVKAGIMQAAK